MFSDLLGPCQCRSSDNLPSHCKRRSVQKQRRSRSSDGECHFNIHQHPLYYDNGKGMFNIKMSSYDELKGCVKRVTESLAYC